MKSVIIGINGTELTVAEIALLQDYQPLGIILFARNIKSIPQTKKLISAIRNLLNRDNAPVLIDEEGGIVSRLKPPIWPKSSSNKAFGDLYAKNPALAENLLEMQINAISAMLLELGINVNCAPCVDLLHIDTHSVISARSFSNNPQIVIKLGKISINQFKFNNILPIIKHFPGHGPAIVDSHQQLPIITKEFAKLIAKDFYIFEQLALNNLIMVGHLAYKFLEQLEPISNYKQGLDFIKNKLNISAKLISDCITMQALNGDLTTRATNVFNAGIDIVLCSKAEIADYKSILINAPVVSTSDYQKYNFPTPINTVIADYRKQFNFINETLKLNDIELYQQLTDYTNIS